MERAAFFVWGLIGVLYLIHAVATPGRQLLEACIGGAISGVGFTAWWERR